MKKGKKTLGFTLLLAGVGLSVVLFMVAELDDAPGLAAIGLVMGSLWVAAGMLLNEWVRIERLVWVVLLGFGLFGILLSSVLWLDGELDHNIALFGVGMGVSVLLLLSAWAIQRRFDRRKR